MFNTRKYKNRLASEYDALIMIEAKHAGDARFRLAIAAILAALLYVRGFPIFAMACLVGLYFVELLHIASIKAFKKLPLSREAQVLQITSLVIVGVSVWAALSAAMWLTDNPILQVYGFAMLIGISVHIGMMYSESRFLTISALTPLTATVVGMLVYYHGYAQQSVTDNPKAFRPQLPVALPVQLYFRDGPHE